MDWFFLSNSNPSLDISIPSSKIGIHQLGTTEGAWALYQPKLIISWIIKFVQIGTLDHGQMSQIVEMIDSTLMMERIKLNKINS